MANREPRDKNGRLRRKPNELPEHVKQALEQAALRADFDARPAYQRDEYLAWLTRAKQPEVRAKRLALMLAELEAGGVFMRGDHPDSKK
jgi:uncharacterized protein YdeI (YjbR/CyaY-like superfamily)